MRRLGVLLLGLVMVLAGIGMTTGSYFFARMNGVHFFLINYGLIIAGLGLMARALFFSGDWKRPRRLVDGGLNPLAAVPPGQCWNCGRRVKPNVTLCLNCGAAQRSSPNRLG